MGIEIERKWIVTQLPTEVEPEKMSRTEQIYLGLSPVVRLSRNFLLLDPDYPNYYTRLWQKLCLKNNAGGLARIEVEDKIDLDKYKEFAELAAGKEPIQKLNYYYDVRKNCDPAILYGDEGLRFSIVDKGTPTEFIYAEVEFVSKEVAKEFVFPWPSCDAVDVTDEGAYWGMAAYWGRTRGFD